MRRDLRLRTTADFQRVRRVGRTVANPLLVLNYAPSPTGESRFGFIVAKKVGGAVVRNRTRRRLRERLRHYHEAARLRRGVDLVVVARHDAGQASAAALATALDELLHGARLLQAEETG